MTLLIASSVAVSATPPMAMVVPFCALLLGIAILPLQAPSFWERHFHHLSLGLGLFTTGFYVMARGNPFPILDTIVEYLNFMTLIGSLFVISGGISLRVKGESTPVINVIFLFIGAIIANVIGTTGASLLLIRPWIRMNKYRITRHHIIFFIFVISNVGGCLTPVGDPPLFLGFLRGIGFWWVLQHVWLGWLMAVSLLLAVFYVIDLANFRKAPRTIQERFEREHEEWTFRGRRNLLWLALVLAAILFPRSWKIGPAWFSMPLAAIVMCIAAALCYKTTPRHIHESNHFSFGPVKEVAWLFIGIFLTMRPALDILQSGALSISSPIEYYFSSGALSAFLDNAPTYLAFFAAAMGHHHMAIDDAAQVARFANLHSLHVMAVSMGSVFFGAGSYIGNGPNFMVKAIAQSANVNTPSFFGYIARYSLPILLPILAFVGWMCLTRH